jgi:ubiquinone/menaquinone biosynthesis C-methylase UbiE
MTTAQELALPAADPLTDRSRGIWSSGDYDRISRGFRHDAEAFVQRLSIRRGMRVLDAACGSGNLTIPAARTGAVVTGLDLVPSLLVAATRWAEIDGLEIRFDQGSVEKLPYPDRHFDVVLSMFGVMFASRPSDVMSEMARVTKPGGRVALANWTRRGFIGRMLAMHATLLPPPSGIPSPLAWGDQATLREWFDDKHWTLTLTPRVLTFRYPHSPRGTAELFRTSYGPTIRTFEVISEDQRASFAAELTALWESGQRPHSQLTEVEAEYLEVLAVRL